MIRPDHDVLLLLQPPGVAMPPNVHLCEAAHIPYTEHVNRTVTEVNNYLDFCDSWKMRMGEVTTGDKASSGNNTIQIQENHQLLTNKVDGRFSEI